MLGVGYLGGVDVTDHPRGVWQCLRFSKVLMLQYLLRWLQSSNAAKSLSKEGAFKAEVHALVSIDPQVIDT